MTAFRSSYLTKVNKNIKLLSKIGTPGSWWDQFILLRLEYLPWLDLSRTTVQWHGRSHWVETSASSTSFNLSGLVTALKPEDSLKYYLRNCHIYYRHSRGISFVLPIKLAFLPLMKTECKARFPILVSHSACRLGEEITLSPGIKPFLCSLAWNAQKSWVPWISYSGNQNSFGKWRSKR